MLIIIHSKNTALGNKARNKLKKKLKKSYSDENGELQVIQFNERIEHIGIYMNSLYTCEDRLQNKVKEILSKDSDLKVWESKLQYCEGLYIERNEPYDFLLFLDAKNYYNAAMSLKENHQQSFVLLLALSVELFLKCIHTKTRYVGAHGKSVIHLEGHNFNDIYSKLKKLAPDFTYNLEEKYRKIFDRNFIQDLQINSDVFINSRYPYQKGGVIPERPNPLYYTNDEILFGCSRRSEVDVDAIALELTAYILRKHISETFNINETL